MNGKVGVESFIGHWIDTDKENIPPKTSLANLSVIDLIHLDIAIWEITN